MRIILVEDDEILGDGIVKGLKQYGFTIDWVRDGESALDAIRTQEYQLLILDLGLPDMSGYDILNKQRQNKNILPILIITARESIDELVKSLDRGADDFITKPFDLKELAARARALLRRSHGRAVPILTHGAISFDPAAKKVTLNNTPVEFSAKELKILEFMLENKGKVLSRTQLEEQLYGWGQEIESNAVEVHIHNIRKKLGNEFIKNIRGVGYIIPDIEGAT